MHPRTFRMMCAATALTAGLALLLCPSLSVSQEDTAHLILKKKAMSKDRPSAYIVQKGDNLSTIIRRKLGRPAAESASVNRLVRKLNPEIRNVNLIYPGQKITLPRLAEPGPNQYVVNRGDTLSGILHDRLGITRGEMAKWIGLVKKLNLDLVDPNRIYPGQMLILPDRGSAAAVPMRQTAGPEETENEQIAATAYHPTERDVEILAAVIKRAGGSLIRNGKYFIPLTEQEQLAVDCAEIPMVELTDGSRILLDFAHQIPDETANLMRSRWGNFTVITGNGQEDILSMLAAVFAASRDYTFRRHDGYLDMGTTPALKLRVDWILVLRSSEGRETTLLGICRMESRLPPIPEPIVRFAEKKGYPVLEVDAGTGKVRDRQPSQAPSDIPALDPGGNRVLVGSLLDLLGYTYTRDQRIPVRNPSTEGGPLAIRADYSVRIGTRTVVIHFGELPAELQAGLREKGVSLVQIAGDDERRAVVEKVLKGLDIPYMVESIEFRPPEGDSPLRWLITLNALRLTSEKGTLYLVPPDADRDLCAFIRERWNRQIVSY
ncbi:MAG TPA: LysM domain-containing protein [Syntrophales bacterium]|nr:LysM domain-containing protein [Syntrophales bacterium]